MLIEAEVVLGIIALCESGQAELVSSSAIEYEAGRIPNTTRKASAREMIGTATQFVALTPVVEQRARELNRARIKPLDALHLPSAVVAGADYFCTCDDRLLKRARSVHTGPPKIVSPLELIAEIEP